MKTKFLPKDTKSKGWTVVERTGSKKTGFVDKAVDFECGQLTMAQAQAIAAQMNRNKKRQA